MKEYWRMVCFLQVTNEDGNENTLRDTNSSNKKKDIDESQTSTNFVEPSNTEVTKWKKASPENKKQKSLQKKQFWKNVVIKNAQIIIRQLNWVLPPGMTMNVLKKIGMNFSVSLKRNNFKRWKKKGVGWKEIKRHI